MSFEPRDYVRHILVEVNYLLGQRAGLTFETFARDETLRRAFVRSLEIHRRGYETSSGRVSGAASGGRMARDGRHARQTDSRLLRRGLRVGLGRGADASPGAPQVDLVNSRRVRGSHGLHRRRSLPMATPVRSNNS